MGVLLWRGWGIDATMAQCFGNHEDKSSKGRQMPVVRRLIYPKLVVAPHPLRSTGARLNTIFTQSHPRWLLKSHRRPVSRMRFSAILHGADATARRSTSARVLPQRATFMLACCSPLFFRLQHCSSHAITASQYQRRPLNNSLAMV
jgi:hypothetical protein